MPIFFRTLKFFFSSYCKETSTVVVLLFLAGLMEAIGVTAFLPFLQIVLEGKISTDNIPVSFVRTFIIEHNIPLNFMSVGLFIIAAIGAKALILLYALRKVSLVVAHISSDLRQKLIEALLQAKWKYFLRNKLGTSLNAIVMESFRSAMAFLLATRLMSATIQFLVYAVSALLLSWNVFVGTIVFGSLMAAMLWSLVRGAQKAGVVQTVMAKNLMTQMAEMLQGIKPLRAMALESKFMSLLTGHSKKLEDAQAQELTVTQFLRVLYEPIMVVMAIIGLYMAIYWGNLSGSQLALMVVVFIRLLTSINAMQTEYQKFVKEESGLWSLLDNIEKTKRSRDEWRGAQKAPDDIQIITLKDVHFSYDEKNVLRGASIEFQPKTMTTLIGESGSGKTSILDLLSGFYTPDSGSIKINTQELKDIKLEDWRKNLGFVPQEVFLFNDTIAENIKVGRDEIPDEDIWEALEKAGARSFVEKLDRGLNAPVGEGGRMLSGGQRQRIAIARAIVHKPKILLLDEATSALDNETEKNLLATLQKLARDITIIFASHNIIVQDYADKVYKIRNGRIEAIA